MIYVLFYKRKVIMLISLFVGLRYHSIRSSLCSYEPIIIAVIERNEKMTYETNEK